MLRALLGRGVSDFLVRAAALETIIGAGRGTYRPAEIQRLLGWLVEPQRSTVLSALRSSEWVTYDPAIGYRITDLGFWTPVDSFRKRRFPLSSYAYVRTLLSS